MDAVGKLVASNLPSSGTVRTLEMIDRALPAAQAGHYSRSGQPRWFTTTAVPGSSLRLAASVPGSDLYGPVSGTSVWLPWIIVLTLTLASLYSIHVLFALHRSREDYLALARIDPLTGIFNRRELSASAIAMLGAARRSNEEVGVLMLDLDHFKAVNDTRGHESGDEVLRVVSARIRNALREGDVLGRWGGEEFVAFLPATTLAQAMVVADRVRLTISRTPISVVAADPVSVTASVG